MRLRASIAETLKTRAQKVAAEIVAIQDQGATAVEQKRNRIEQLESEMNEIHNVVENLPRL